MARIWGWKVKLALLVAVALAAMYFGARLATRGREAVRKETFVSEVEKIPKFEVAAYRIKSKSIGRLSEDKHVLGLTYGTATLMYTYDAWVTLGVKDPSAIEITRGEGNEVFVRESTVSVEVLDSKTENYRMIGFDASNVLVPKTVEIKNLFGSQADDKGKAEALAVAKENMDAAKENFKENYERLCAALGLKVVWR